MNYYKRHIGDYMKDASHLSLLEHGVYMRLLDVYYTRESAIPVDQAARLIGARSKEERDALACVSREFFEVVDGHLVQQRCEVEIAQMRHKAETNRVVGRAGGRPKKKTQNAAQTTDSGNPEITQTVSENNPNETLATNHKPLANNHNQHTHWVDQEPSGPDSPVCDQPTDAGLVCKAMKAQGIADTSPSHPTLLELLGVGASRQEFVDAAAKAVESGKGFAYALGIVVNARKQARKLAEQLHHGPLPVAETPYQRAMRQRMSEFAPSAAKQAHEPEPPTGLDADGAGVRTIDVLARHVGVAQ